ncbi:MAG: 1-acyl-sn-glycerol-3-phosphate acyltransferase [Elusimicrobia bacterium]|nr:1-acyl-sn-glycerol-3-phosphate acyltransferase [Elusimicrobiota bacterium]
MKKHAGADPRLISTPLHQLTEWLIDAMFLLTHQINISGGHHVSAPGGIIVAANHQSLWDPPMLGYAMTKFFHRRPYFLAKAELFRNPLLGWIISRLGALRLERQAADRAALRKALYLLNRGEALALFPEGTRKRENSLERFLPGVGFLAVKAKVPITPCHISYGTNWPRLGSKVLLRFGPMVTAGDDTEETARRLLGEVKLLARAPQ